MLSLFCYAVIDDEEDAEAEVGSNVPTLTTSSLDSYVGDLVREDPPGRVFGKYFFNSIYLHCVDIFYYLPPL